MGFMNPLLDEFNMMMKTRTIDFMSYLKLMVSNRRFGFIHQKYFYPQFKDLTKEKGSKSISTINRFIHH